MASRILREGVTIFVLTTTLLALAATVGIPSIHPRAGSADAAMSFEESLRSGASDAQAPRISRSPRGQKGASRR